LRLSKKTEYGLRAVVQLARLEPHRYVQARDLSSGREKLPRKFLEAVLAALRQNDFLQSRVGSGGGYRLSRHPRDISVGDLIRQLEHRLAQTDEDQDGELTPGQIACHLLNENLTRAVDRAMRDVTLEELMKDITKASDQQQQMYYI
jgi:Rrf2 family protein